MQNYNLKIVHSHLTIKRLFIKKTLVTLYDYKALRQLPPFFPPLACISDANNAIQNLNECWLWILSTASIILVFTRQKLQTMLGSLTAANARYNVEGTTTKLKPEFSKSGDISFYTDYQCEDGVIKGWQHWGRLWHVEGTKRVIFKAGWMKIKIKHKWIPALCCQRFSLKRPETVCNQTFFQFYLWIVSQRVRIRFLNHVFCESMNHRKHESAEFGLCSGWPHYALF